MTKIAFLDADFIIKTNAIKRDDIDSTLFDEILKLPYDIKITRKILNEVKGPLQKKLINYIVQGQLSIIDNTEYFNLTTTILGVDAQQRMILSEIKKICVELTNSEDLYNKFFIKLEILHSMSCSMDDFCKEFNKIVLNSANDNHIGELTVLLNISLIDRMGTAEILSLLSHDTYARRCMFAMSGIASSYDCFTCFSLLQEESIIDYDHAKKYASAWLRVYPQNRTVAITKGTSSNGITIHELMKIIFIDKNYKILKNGRLKLS